jgi:hypothetical protein
MQNAILPLIVFLLLPPASAAELPCIEQRAEIVRVLQHGAERLRRSLEQIQSSKHLSDESKSYFRRDAEWVIAWSEDQYAQMGRRGCSDFTELTATIKAQWIPVQLRLFSLRASQLLWYVEQLLNEVSVEQKRAMLEEAKQLLRESREADRLSDARWLLRRAVFLTRQAFRSVEKTATME